METAWTVFFGWEENMKVTNGKDVARLLVDEYLNCHPTGHKKLQKPRPPLVKIPKTSTHITAVSNRLDVSEIK